MVRVVAGSLFNRESLVFQAIDEASHRGYQAWHREYDQKVVRWLNTDGARATAGEFLGYLGDIYQTSDLSRRFPGAWQQIQQMIEKFP